MSSEPRTLASYPKPKARGPKNPKRLRRNVKPRNQRKTTLAKAKRDLWDLFAAYVKERDGNVCFTCDATGLEGRNWQAGHMLPGRGGVVLFHPELVRSQCFRCNMTLKGNAAEFALRYMQRFGDEKFKVHVLGARHLRQWTMADIQRLTTAIKTGGACYELLYAEMEAEWQASLVHIYRRLCRVCWHPCLEHRGGCQVAGCDCTVVPGV